MSLAIFIVGVFVFLITVYGTVVTGGLLLTERQLDEQPEFEPDAPTHSDGESTADRARRVITAEF
jgi:hypothetical protein